METKYDTENGRDELLFYAKLLGVTLPPILNTPPLKPSSIVHRLLLAEQVNQDQIKNIKFNKNDNFYEKTLCFAAAAFAGASVDYLKNFRKEDPDFFKWKYPSIEKNKDAWFIVFMSIICFEKGYFKGQFFTDLKNAYEIKAANIDTYIIEKSPDNYSLLSILAYVYWRKNIDPFVLTIITNKIKNQKERPNNLVYLFCEALNVPQEMMMATKKKEPAKEPLLLINVPPPSTDFELFLKTKLTGYDLFNKNSKYKGSDNDIPDNLFWGYMEKCNYGNNNNITEKIPHNGITQAQRYLLVLCKKNITRTELEDIKENWKTAITKIKEKSFLDFWVEEKLKEKIEQLSQ
jgi:hypothetical protein